MVMAKEKIIIEKKKFDLLNVVNDGSKNTSIN